MPQDISWTEELRSWLLKATAKTLVSPLPPSSHSLDPLPLSPSSLVLTKEIGCKRSCAQIWKWARLSLSDVTDIQFWN